MASSSDDSDSPLVDDESGLPILLLGSDDPVPKHSYENVVRIDSSRKRPRTCRRRKIGVAPLTVEGNGQKNEESSVTLSLQPGRNALASNQVVENQNVAGDSDYLVRGADDDHSVDMSSDFGELYSEYSSAATDMQEVLVSTTLKDIYMVKVLQARAFMVVDVACKTFLIQDFDLMQKHLMIHGFHFIERVTLMLKDGKCWVLSCSCDKNRQRYVKALGKNLDVDLNELKRIINSRFSECIHVDVCYDLITMFDSVNNVDPFQEVEEYDIEHSYGKDLPTIQEISSSENPMLLVKPPAGVYAVVGIDRKGFVCYQCIAGRHSCSHVSSVTACVKHGGDKIPDFLLDIAASQEELKQSDFTSFILKPISRGRISWVTTPKQRQIYSLSSQSKENILDDGTMALIPTSNACPNCGGDMSTVVEYERSKKRLLLWADIIQVTVFVRRCKICTHECTFCGSADGILHMGSFLIGHDVLRDYLNLFLTGNSCSLIGFHEKWQLNYEAAGFPPDSLINYQQLRHSWYAYLSLLDIDYENGFMCDICGRYPDVVTCDATTIGFKRIFAPISNQIRFQEHGKENLLNGSFATRTLLKDKELRTLLRNYADRREMDTIKICRLKHLLEVGCKPLSEFVDWCEKTFERSDLIPPSIMSFIRCMSSISPVCSYFPNSEVFQCLKAEIKNGLNIRNDPNKLQLLQSSAPVLFSVILDLPTGIPPIELSNLFDTLERKVLDTFSQEAHALTTVSQDEILNSFSFLPNWPILNVRGLYKQDIIGSKKRHLECNKDYRGHPTLMPGIFTLYCKHDICYGFDVMQTQESPDVPFTLFRTRFPKAPGTIIYDNSCNLHAYCLNRDPGFFKDTLFLVDRFHWKNHKACANSYYLSIYPQYAGLNSQINEQRNSKLKRAKPQLSYMNPTNFVNSCRLLLWFCNMKVKKAASSV